ncbi:MAG TPA: CoA transferase [Candidatus Eisenbacteria bacterium]|nr:CoA transferase [Candidatus Eisenbacteria bacterium]
MTDPLVRPLEGVRVLELAHLIAGPTGGMYLADMGADVVKVESREAPDASRSVYGVARAGEGILHLTVNRNKRALCLDLQKPAGRETFYRVVRTADVVLEGYRNGVAEKLGIDYATLAPMNPRLIYCSVSAFGPAGPWREKPGLDALAQAVGGLMAVTGEVDGGPALVGAPVVDTIGGLLAAQGILLALLARARTGQGQKVDVSLLDGVLLSHLARLSVFHETGVPLGRYGSGHPNLVPYQAFGASDGWIFVAVWRDATWAPFCATVGRPDLATDPRFVSGADRVAHRKELEPLIESIMAGRTIEEWMAALSPIDVLCAPVNDYTQLVRHPAVLATSMIVEQEHPRAGRITTMATPVKLEKTQGTIRTGAPALGEHSRDILRETGLTTAEIDLLAADGVI